MRRSALLLIALLGRTSAFLSFPGALHPALSGRSTTFLASTAVGSNCDLQFARGPSLAGRGKHGLQGSRRSYCLTMNGMSHPVRRTPAIQQQNLLPPASTPVLAGKHVALRSTAEGAGEPEKMGIGKMLSALYKFTRPHTIRGTILASCACVTRAFLITIRDLPYVEWHLIQTALIGLVALLCGNAYIVGINQIYDVDIDKVNKPFLPVAANQISPAVAWAICLATCFGGLGIVYHFFSPLIMQLYCLGVFFGTVYTVPPFRWKNNPLLAAFSIAMVRGLLLNVGLHHASSAALGLPITWPPQVVFISAFMTVFALVIAVAKDLPDVEGDRKYKVSTFASDLGVSKAAKLVIFVLMCNYGMGVTVGLFAEGVNRVLMVGAHLALAAWLALFSRQLQPDSMKSIKLFYRNIWKLFYTEYLLFPFI